MFLIFVQRKLNLENFITNFFILLVAEALNYGSNGLVLVKITSGLSFFKYVVATL
jgi:hypothetical protein